MDAILILPLFSDILSQLFTSSSSNLAVFLAVFSTIYIYASIHIEIHNLVDHREYFSLFVCVWVSDNRETVHICGTHFYFLALPSHFYTLYVLSIV